MRPKTLLILTAITAALGLYIVFFERSAPTTDERREQEKKVLDLDRDEVTSLVLAWNDTTVRLERDARAATQGDPASALEDRDWRLVEPFSAAADTLAADGLLDRLSDLESNRTIESVDRAAADFVQPRGTVTLITEGGDEHVLEIGPEVVASGDMLVAVRGSVDADQVASSLWDDLTKDPGAWRDKSLFPGTRADLQRITLRQGERTVHLAKRGDVFWIEQPLVDRADAGHASALVSALTGLRAEQFLDDPADRDPARTGLATPSGTLEATLTEPQAPFVVTLGNETAEAGVVHGRVDDLVFTARTTLGEALVRDATAWRARGWTGHQVFQLDEATVTDASGTFALRRIDGAWRRDDVEIDFAKASDVLYAVTELQADTVEDRTDEALPEATLTIALVDEDGDGETLSVHPMPDGRLALASNVRNALLMVSGSALDALRTKIEEARIAVPPSEQEADDPASDASTDAAP